MPCFERKIYNKYISLDMPDQKDLALTKSLMETLHSFSSYEPTERTEKREKVLQELNVLADDWIQNLTKDRAPEVENAKGKILVYGSFKLGVHSSGSDIDAVLIAPIHVNRNDFFSSFKEILDSSPKVTDLITVPMALTPLIKMNYDGVDVDLLFARLKIDTIPDDLDLSDDAVLQDLDLASVRCLDGCRVAERILDIVPNQKSFQVTLRVVKIWAKNHGLYSNCMGFLGGISWAILAARICQLYPNASPSRLVQKFFYFLPRKFGMPVQLELFSNTISKWDCYVWNPAVHQEDRRHALAICTPAYPQQNSSDMVTKKGLETIKMEMKNASEICMKIEEGSATWNDLLKEFNHFSMYQHFVALTLKSETDKDKTAFIGFFEARFRSLIVDFEWNKGIKTVRLNPKQFKTRDSDIVWFIGLEFEEKVIDLTKDLNRFKNNIMQQAAGKRNIGDISKIEIGADYVKQSELIKYSLGNELKRGESAGELEVEEKKSDSRKRAATTVESPVVPNKISRETKD